MNLIKTGIGLAVLLLAMTAILVMETPPKHNTFESRDGISLAYSDQGSGPPVILLHAFMIESTTNWIENGVIESILNSGFRVIWMDSRGHGLSDKPHNPDAYAEDSPYHDVADLIDHLKLSEAYLVGYSMGANIALLSAIRDERIKGAIAAGTGAPSDEVWDPADRQYEVQTMREDSPTNPGFYRQTADLIGGGDRHAYAARLEGARFPEYTAQELGQIKSPVCIINGSEDIDGAPLNEMIPGSSLKYIPGDHFSAIWEADFKHSILECLRNWAKT